MSEIQLVNGGVALVDDNDVPLVAGYIWRWIQRKPTEPRYAVSVNRVAGKTVTTYMHRVILGLSDKTHTDHKNRDGLDNRRENLRLASPLQNARNRGPQCNKICRFRGVSRVKGGRFRARIRLNGTLLHLGYFKDEENAGRAYDAAAVKLFGEFACTNFGA